MLTPERLRIRKYVSNGHTTHFLYSEIKTQPSESLCKTAKITIFTPYGHKAFRKRKNKNLELGRPVQDHAADTLAENKIDINREHFWVIGLENNNRILFIELVSMGSINKTIAEPMEVFSLALQKRAVKIILCHNHPSGELESSFEDRDLTDRLIQVGKIVNTPLLDHLIISEKGYMGFGDTGLMDSLEKSTKYVPAYVLEELIRQEAAFYAKKSEKIAIAKAMKKAGEPIHKIVSFTSLTKEEIEELKD